MFQRPFVTVHGKRGSCWHLRFGWRDLFTHGGLPTASLLHLAEQISVLVLVVRSRWPILSHFDDHALVFVDRGQRHVKDVSFSVVREIRGQEQCDTGNFLPGWNAPEQATMRPADGSGT